jgi:hypothetical protein
MLQNIRFRIKPPLLARDFCTIAGALEIASSETGSTKHGVQRGDERDTLSLAGDRPSGLSRVRQVSSANHQLTGKDDEIRALLAGGD